MPGCDGSGLVLAVGSKVNDFRVGDRVVTLVFDQGSDDNALPDLSIVTRSLGHGVDGTLQSHAIFPATTLAHAPAGLDFVTSSTLSCTWVTAWNAFFGIEGKRVAVGDWVLVEGSGGVSVAALQIAITVGATVVATTSSDAKAARLKELGASHVVNYRDNEDWGKVARDLTPGGRGFDHIIDLVGDSTMQQSLAAIRTDGVISLIGKLGGGEATVPLMAIFDKTCIVRGILAGSRAQMRDVVKFIDRHDITPVVDDMVFELEDAKSAYLRLKEQKHFAKVVLRISHE